jgi:hypothetical protein
MMPPEVGMPTLRREIACGAGEVVAAGGLGVMLAEWHETGGLDTERANMALADRKSPFVMLGLVRGAPVHGGLVIETTLDPRQQPFLFDHALEGTPLLPGVMATEAFAEAASLLAPDLEVEAVEDERFDKPLKFHRREPAAFRLTVQARPEGSGLVVSGLITSKIPPRTGLPPVEKEHFRARVRLGAPAPQGDGRVLEPPEIESFDIGRERIYDVYFHGPAYRVLEKAKVEGELAFGVLASDLPPDTAPPGAAHIVEPRLIELCLQTAGLWEIVHEKRLALPQSIGSLRVFPRAHAGNGRRWARVQHGSDGGFSAQVLDDGGRVLVELDGYRTVTLEEGRSLGA